LAVEDCGCFELRGRVGRRLIAGVSGKTICFSWCWDPEASEDDGGGGSLLGESEFFTASSIPRSTYVQI
jgi:hypothetical protein